jgi:hypothetical protein
MNAKQTDKRFSGKTLTLAILPLILLGIVMTYLVITGGGLKKMAGPPLEQITIQRVTLPNPGLILLEVVNDGPQEVTIAQILVDEAYWEFHAEPSVTIPRLEKTLLEIPYPWVAEETHEIMLITSLGATFSTEIAAAVESPEPSLLLFARFGLIGFYVGIVPIFIGLLWFPFMRRLSSRAIIFILSLTLGLLVFLAIGTWIDAVEFARELPSFWQGTPMIIFIAMLTLGALLMIGNRPGKGQDGEKSPLRIAYLIAVGIGIHNLGEGLAIGASFVMGEAALGSFLVIGFTLHNITEGVGIAAPIIKKAPGLKHFVFLILLAGAPAILGTWFGGFAFNPVLATAFLAIGVGAILQVIWEVGKLVVRETARLNLPRINWVNLGGVTVGLVLMYFTAFMVKF